MRSTTSARHSVAGRAVGREVPVAGVVDGVALVVEGQRRRRDVVAAAPQLHLLVAELCGGLLLVEALEGAVVALVQPPVAPHREPAPAELVEGQVGGAHGPGQHRGVHAPAGRGPALLGRAAARPPGGPRPRPWRSGRRRSSP